METLKKRLAESGLEFVVQSPNRIMFCGPSNQFLVKRWFQDNLREQAFFFLKDIPGVRFLNYERIFAIEDEIYALVRMDPLLEIASSVEEALPCAIALYQFRSMIGILTPKLSLDDLVRRNHNNYDLIKADNHPAPSNASLELAIEYFHQITDGYWPREESRLVCGLVHEDLNCHNIMRDSNGFCLIDPDPVLHSYSVMNASNFFVNEIIVKKDEVNFGRIRSQLLLSLESSDREAFDFFVLLSLYRLLIRRSFHRDLHTPKWAEEFHWLFQDFGVDFFLKRLEAANRSES